MGKHIGHAVFFIIGAALGIWWGVNHPANAQQIADMEQQQADRVQTAVAQAKLQFAHDQAIPPPHTYAPGTHNP